MSIVAAHDLAETRDCSTPNCIRDASDAPTRGPYANKCAEHRELTREKIAAGASASALRRWHGDESARNGSDEPRPLPLSRPQTKASLKEAAQKLVPVAAELDKALLRKRTANGDAKRCFEAFKVAFEEIQATAKRALEP